MNTVKHFSLSGVLVAFIAALLLFGSLLLATTQNAYAEEIDTTASYTSESTSAYFATSKTGHEVGLTVKKGEEFFVLAACMEPSLTWPKGNSVTYASEDKVEKSLSTGRATLEGHLDKMKEIIYIYSETDKLDDYFKDVTGAFKERGKYEAVWEALLQTTGQTHFSDFSDWEDTTTFGNRKGAYEYLIGDHSDVNVPDGLELAFFENIVPSPTTPGTTQHAEQTLVALKLYGSSSGGTTEKVKTKVSKAWKNADGTTTWPSSVSQVEIEVSYNNKVVDTIKLTSADTEPKETAEYDKVDGATFSVKEKTVKGYTSEVTGNDTDGFVVTNTESSEDTPTPAIQTSATGTSGNTIEAAAGQTITDTVTYSGLTVGTKYVLEGKLFDKSTGAEITTDYSCTANNFEPENSSGETTVTFTLDATDLAGKSLVVYEYLYTVDAKGEKSSEPVATHEEIDDAAQTITVNEAAVSNPLIIKTTISVGGTAATDGKLLQLNEGGYAYVTDTVDYRGLSTSTEYVVVGELYEFTGKGADAEMSDEPVATGESAAFTPSSDSGSCTIDFGNVPVKTNAYYVAFEYLYASSDTDRADKLASHEDENDVLEAFVVKPVDTEWPIITENNITVNDFNTANPLSMATTVSINDKAASSTAARTVASDDVSKVKNVKDTIAYKGFDPNKTYTVKAELIDTTTGKAITNGTATKTQTPDSKGEGTWTMDFTGITLEGGKTYVVYEYAYENDADGKPGETPVAQHADPNDKAQTIVTEGVKPSTTTNVTGATQTAKTADTATGVALLAALVAAGSAALLLGARRKSHN